MDILMVLYRTQKPILWLKRAFFLSTQNWEYMQETTYGQTYK